MIKTPVLLLMFNRPDTTKLVFDAIRKQQPRYLYIAADGVRPDHPDDIRLCQKCREIVSLIDWKCDVHTLYREKNLGSKYAVSSAISWLFAFEDEGIILEDDCLPGESFFSFCENLLSKYRYDNQVMHITGTNLNDTIKFGDGGYYYSRYPNNWGWATWKRAWNYYDLELENTDLYKKLIEKSFKHKSERLFWESRILLLKANSIDAWDYQWMFTILRENGICLNSNYNLVTNIGFGINATHTTGKSIYITPEIREIKEIKHPSSPGIIRKAEIQFLQTTHGVIRRGYLNYYLHIYFIQRCHNLVHKIKLRINKAK